MPGPEQNDSGVRTRQERREERRQKRRAKIKQHGRALARVYRDAILKRVGRSRKK